MQSAGDFMHPVISLRKAYSIRVCLRPPKGTENTITRYRFSKEDVVGFVEDDSAEYDVMTVVMVRLGEPGTAGYNGILGLLGTLLSKKVSNDEKLRVLSDEYGIEPGAGLKEGVTLVGTLGELIYEDAKAETKAEDEAKTALFIKNLMANTGWSLDYTMDMLAMLPEDRERYRELIESTATPEMSKAES